MEGDSAAVFVTVQKIYYPLLCIMGIPANLFTLYIICYRKCGMSNTAIIYLSSLAIVDTFYIVWVILIDLTLTFWTQQPFWHSHPWCGILGFLQYGSLYSSSWIVVVFTIERCLVLRSTAAKQRFSQAGVTKLTCLAIVLASHLVSVPLGWINVVIPVNFTMQGENVTLPRCRYREQPYTTAIVWITSFLSGGIPITLVIVFNSLIGCHLCRASNLFTKEERRFMQGRSTRSMLRRTLLLLGTVSLAFVVLSLPRFVTYCILRTVYNNGSFNRNDYSILINVAGDVANMLQNLNSTTNFLLYCMVSRCFRRELVHLLTCGGRAPDPGSVFTHTTMKVFSVATHQHSPAATPSRLNQAQGRAQTSRGSRTPVQDPEPTLNPTQRDRRWNFHQTIQHFASLLSLSPSLKSQ